LVFNASTRTVTDELTGRSLRTVQQQDFEFIYRYHDPAVAVVSKRFSTLGACPAGTVDLRGELIYDRAPTASLERVLWGTQVGYCVKTRELGEFYRLHLKVEALLHPEVKRLVSEAMDFIRAAIIMDCHKRPSDPVPIVDLDGTLSTEVRCRILRRND
jgi:hypothetical protein